MLYFLADEFTLCDRSITKTEINPHLQMKPFGLMMAMCESLSERLVLPRYSPTAK